MYYTLIINPVYFFIPYKSYNSDHINSDTEAQSHRGYVKMMNKIQKKQQKVCIIDLCASESLYQKY